MKIAFISQYFFPESFSNNEIARDLVARGHAVDVVTGVPNYPAGRFFPGYSNRRRRRETWEGVRIHRALTVPRGTRNWQLTLNYLVYPLAAAWVFLTQARSRYDVSFVSMPSPVFQAAAGVALRWIRGTPTVYWVQDIWPESAVYTLGLTSRPVVRTLEAISGWIYRRADLVLVQSQAFPAMIERFGVAPERIRVLPNTAPDGYRPLPRGADPGIAARVPGGRFVLMFAGNIGESQDFDTLIDAAILARAEAEITWAILGSGRDMERVAARVREEGLEDVFVFLGRFPETDMPAFFAEADAMLVSLKKTPIFELTVPYKVQCYMACGKPILAALDGEGARIVETSGAGISVPSGDAERLAAAAVALARSSPDRLAEMRASALDFFERTYSRARVMGDLEAWLREAAETAGRGARR